MIKKITLVIVLFLVSHAHAQERHSLVKEWMDIVLGMIEEDGQGPTIQARNLFHTSAALNDAWAAYEPNQETYFLGKHYNGFELPFNKGFKRISKNTDSLKRIAMTHAAYGVAYGRYSQYGSKGRTIDHLHDKMEELGYHVSLGKTNYEDGSPEALGNYIAEYIVELGDNDNSKEDNRYESDNYNPSNEFLRPDQPGTGVLNNPNGWQPIQIAPYILQKGNDRTLKDWNYLLVEGNTLFLTSHWGEVFSFALPPTENYLHFDPGTPPLFDTSNIESTEAYRWGFQMVQDWSGYLDPRNPNVWDVSPKGITSMDGHLPKTLKEYQTYFNNAKNNIRNKATKNPYTKKTYPKNIVKQGDYCRVTAEFWVDGPNTKSPPGHWLEFLGKVSYHPDFQRKWNGKGKPLSSLEWDIKSYFLMTGTLHDAAIACWSIKNNYDYVRPITAIRFLAGLGQSSDSNLPNYNPHGFQLIRGSAELVLENDPLVGKNKEHLHKIKIYAWQGPDAVNNPISDTAGSDWILAENWWPYQRYTFATPPFAGYTSGHSTFSIAGAEILNYMTGSPYFPGGLQTFHATKDEFLLFEKGPQQDVTLQWATFYDAAIETCLSRVWGGIHPPVDDIEGRRVGKKVAENSIKYFKKFAN